MKIFDKNQQNRTNWGKENLRKFRKNYITLKRVTDKKVSMAMCRCPLFRRLFLRVTTAPSATGTSSDEAHTILVEGRCVRWGGVGIKHRVYNAFVLL